METLTTNKTGAKHDTLTLAREVLHTEASAIEALAKRLDQNFARAVDLILLCKGRVVVSGMGKSGHIASKIAATLASTGTPAFFMHPAEACHGDLGMITPLDIVIAISYSGETEELLAILPLIKRMEARLISITGNNQSALAREADIHLDAYVSQEACPLGLAPTASTTAALALGDALAVAVLDQRGFSADDFARSHPGGALGRRLLLHVRDVMRDGSATPKVGQDATLSQGLLEMSQKGMGMTAVVDSSGRAVGVFTDGDLRRALENSVNITSTTMREVMHENPKNITADRLAVDAVELMEHCKISALIVVDGEGKLVGALNMHDLLRAKVV